MTAYDLAMAPDGLVEPAAPYDDHVLVHCPRCNEKAMIHGRMGTVRLTCPTCAFVQATQLPGPVSSGSWLERYNEGEAMFGESLWLETTCCGERRLWALNSRHLDYIEWFVLSTERDADFPSAAGNRQLSDKFPAWMVSSKHRSEVARALQRLRSTL